MKNENTLVQMIRFNHGFEYRNLQGELHNDNGPAVVFDSGRKTWFFNGKRHREDGPARENPNGRHSWYLNGIKYSQEKWEQELAKIKLKRILDL
jgi:hypothetical protein